MHKIEVGQVYYYTQGRTNQLFKILEIDRNLITYTCSFGGDWLDNYTNSSEYFNWKMYIEYGSMILITKAQEYLYA